MIVFDSNQKTECPPDPGPAVPKAPDEVILPPVAANDLKALAKSARATFQILEPWSHIKFNIENDLLKDIVSFIKTQSTSFYHAIDMSLETSRCCLELSTTAITLCSHIAAKRDIKEISATLDFLLNLTSSGAKRSTTAVQKFRAVRQGLFRLSQNLSCAKDQVDFEHRTCIKFNQRHKRAHKVLQVMHCGVTKITHVIPALAPLLNSALPGLGIILPVALELFASLVGKGVEKSYHSIEKRGEKLLALNDAISQLEKIAVDIGEIESHVGKFVTWWQAMDITFEGLQRHVRSLTTLDSVFLNTLRGTFAAIEQMNRIYLSEITCLQDFYPILAETDRYQHFTGTGTVALQANLVDILHRMSQSTHDYHLAYGGLRVSAKSARQKDRADLDKSLEAIRHSLFGECETLHGIVKLVIGTAQSQFESSEVKQIRDKLGLLVDYTLKSRSTFEEHRPIVVGKCPEKGEKYPESLDRAIQQQNSCIEELVQYFNLTFSAITFSRIADESGRDLRAPSELCNWDIAAMTKALDKFAISADSLTSHHALPMLA